MFHTSKEAYTIQSHIRLLSNDSLNAIVAATLKCLFEQHCYIFGTHPFLSHLFLSLSTSLVLESVMHMCVDSVETLQTAFGGDWHAVLVYYVKKDLNSCDFS